MRKTDKHRLLKKIVLCKYPKCWKKNCLCSHSQKEVEETKAKLKKETCTKWMDCNYCKYGETCSLLHGFKELENFSPYTCQLTKEIQIGILSKSFDIFPNGNFLIQKNDGFCIFDSNGKSLLNINHQNDISYYNFHIIDNETIVFSDGQNLIKAKLVNTNKTLSIVYTCKRKLEIKLNNSTNGNDFYKILPNGNITMINGKNLEIINQDFSLIKTCMIPLKNNEKIDISKYAIFIYNNKIYISTSFKKTYIYDFELNLLSEEINDYFKENTIIGIGDKILFLWFEENNKIGCFKFNEYSNNMEKNEKQLKFKIKEIYKSENNNYFIGRRGTVLIFYSAIDLKIVGFCKFSNKEGKVMIKNGKIYILLSGEKIEVYSIKHH